MYTYTHTYFNDSDQLAGSIAFYLKLINIFCWLVSAKFHPHGRCSNPNLGMMAMETANCSARPTGDAAQPCQPGVTIGVTMRRPRHDGWTSAQAAVKFRLGLLVRSFSSLGLASASPSGALHLQKLNHKRQFSPGTHGPEPYHELWIQLGTQGPSRYQKESTR